MRRKLLRRDTLPVKTTREVVTHSISIFQNLCNFQCSISSTMFTVVQKDFVGFALNTNLFMSPCAQNTQEAERTPRLHGHAPSCHQGEIARCQWPSVVYFWLELWPSVLFSLMECLALEWSAVLRRQNVITRSLLTHQESHQDLYQTPSESAKLIAFSRIRGQKYTKLEASVYSPSSPPLGHLTSLTNEFKTQGHYKCADCQSKFKLAGPLF